MKQETLYVTNNYKEYLTDTCDKSIRLNKSVQYIRKHNNITGPLVVCDGFAYICNNEIIKAFKKSKLKKGDKNYD